MPFPFVPPKEGGYTSPSYIVLKSRPECAISIAMIASASANLEEELARLIAVASGHVFTYQSTGQSGSYSAAPNTVARAALDALESMSSRLAVVRAILQVSVSPELCAEFEDHATTIRRAAKMRNDVVHAVWTIHPSRPNDLLKPPEDRGGKYMRYTPKCFDAIVKRFAEENWKLHGFKMKCAKERAQLSQRGAP